MPEVPPSGELDLSNLDNLLSDLEKDLPNIEKDLQAQSGRIAVGPAPVLDESLETPAPPVPPEVKSIPEPLEDEDPPHHELVASPVPPNEKDDPPDNMEDMFTDEEESEWSSGATVEGVEEPVEPTVVAAAPEAQKADETTAVEGSARAVQNELEPETEAAPQVIEPQPAVEDISFEDALELEPEPPVVTAPPPSPSFEESLELEETLAAPPPPMPPPAAARAVVPDPPSVRASPEEFTQAVKDRNFAQAVKIGRLILSSDSPPDFRMNLAGALFYAGQTDEAENELLGLLQEFPYHIAARRNLEVVRAGKT